MFADVHYYNYPADCEIVDQVPPAQFVSEFGWQSLPSFHLWDSYGPGSWSLCSALMQYRIVPFEVIFMDAVHACLSAVAGTCLGDQRHNEWGCHLQASLGTPQSARAGPCWCVCDAGHVHIKVARLGAGNGI
jgi:hypothetical protein